MPTLPYGAKEIIALRSSGKRPADMVLISLIGPLRGENNPIVIAQPGHRYDWSFLIGLECLIVAESTQPKQAVRQVLEALKALPTEYLGLWLADIRNGRHVIVEGVEARPKGLLRFMSDDDRKQFASLGRQQEHTQCA